MYEDYYGFTEKPFSLTPDPKFLFKSESHANAFDLLQYAVRRREGFVVVTGDIGTGKTTLCRALLEDIDRNTFTALVLNPFLSEEDLLKLILQDFGVVSREDVKRGRLTGISKQELIETIYDFLLGLLPLRASAVLIIDEAQNLPLPVLEQIPGLRIVEPAEQDLCCGSAGIYNVVQPEAARELGDRKAGHVLATGAQAYASANPGCLVQVSQALRRAKQPLPAFHPIELVDASIRNLGAGHMLSRARR
jgi:general secretion pathway protein A